MNLALFGGSGATGRRVLELAGTRGVTVRSLIRPRSSLGTALPPTVSTVVGTLDSQEDIDRTLAGCDAACLVFGPRPPYTDVFCGAATERILTAMKERGIRRVICQTGAMVGNYRGNRTFPFESARRLYASRHPAAAADRVRQERAVAESGLDWTLIKPPRLTDGPASFQVRSGPRVRVGLMSSVPRLDLAYLILTGFLENRFMHTPVFVRKSIWRVPILTPQMAKGLSFEAFDGLPEESQALGVTDAWRSADPSGRRPA